ncbi:hypothetical protein [Streptomyces sp. B1I3]|uniref:hypothetical protein n=1 Tax=Streptomyces sp. B1I3 TaxID=3042264 RepID=UPI00277E91BC|nr:hypothetical protein [Streptomyces sp. B1I3]MDQ0791943.1 hypothetical protein [Streptomyces sp. B1I3]
MKIRIAIAAAAVAVALAGLTGCGASYDDKVAACRKELTERSEDATGKPKGCADLSKDDYARLAIVVAAEKEGWIDENGDVDMGEMIEDGSEG